VVDPAVGLALVPPLVGVDAGSPLPAGLVPGVSPVAGPVLPAAPSGIAPPGASLGEAAGDSPEGVPAVPGVDGPPAVGQLPDGVEDWPGD
jgi:hypothetical protein